MEELKITKRYLIQLDGITIGQADTFNEMADVLGCSRQHVYRSFDGKYITLRSKWYRIIDIHSYYYEDVQKTFY